MWETVGLAQCIAIAALLAAGGLFYARMRERRQAEEAQRRSRELSDGIVLRADGDRIVDVSEGASRIPGAEPGASLADVIGGFLSNRSDEARGALSELVSLGRPVRMMVTDADDTAFELIGTPRGGEIRVVLRDASLMSAEIEKAESRIAERERALATGWYERRTMTSLLASGSAIAWQRAPEGKVLWSEGRVSSSDGSVSAEQAVSLIRAWPADQRSDRPDVDRGRIELLPPGAIEPLPLHVIEVRSPDGTRTGFATDASQAASAERTLSRFVQTMTETFAHLTVGLAIFDRNQRLALFNPALAQLLGLDPAWLANRPGLRELIDTLRTSRRIPETGDFHAWRDRMLALFRNTERAEYDETWHLADGSSMKVLARPHPHGALAFIFDDVSERVRLERSYRESIDLRRATLNRLGEAIAVFGTDGRLQFVNDAFHEIWGTDPASFGTETHVRDIMQLCRGLTVETEVWQRIVSFITSDDTRRGWTARVTLGSNRLLSARVALLPGGATMIVFADITDSERIALALSERNEALEAAEEMRTAVLDQISHRLRTPLNTIFGFGQLLTDARFGQLSERQREYAQGILEASGQLLDTIDDVTDLASLQLDPVHDQGEDPPLADTMELARALLEKRAAEAGITLAATLPDSGLRVRCDAVQLRQVLFNMAAGAIQLSEPGSHIALSAGSLPDGRVELRVTSRAPAPFSADMPEDDGATLAFSVTRRMVQTEGGTFERRVDAARGETVTLSIFDAAAAGPDVGTGGEGAQRALPLM